MPVILEASLRWFKKGESVDFEAPMALAVEFAIVPDAAIQLNGRHE